MAKHYFLTILLDLKLNSFPFNHLLKTILIKGIQYLPIGSLTEKYFSVPHKSFFYVKKKYEIEAKNSQNEKLLYSSTLLISQIRTRFGSSDHSINITTKHSSSLCWVESKLYSLKCLLNYSWTIILYLLKNVLHDM